jgi:hypothetical protein
MAKQHMPQTQSTASPGLQMSLPEPQMCIDPAAAASMAQQNGIGNAEIQQQIQQQPAAPAAKAAKKPNKWTNPDVAKISENGSNINKAVSQVAELGHADAGYSNTLKGVGAALDFTNCVASGDNVAESTGGSMLSCGIKTGIDTFLPSGPGANPLGWVNTANSYMDVDNPGKFATQTVSDLNPYANMSKGIKGGVDAADTLIELTTGSDSAAYRKADALEQRSRDGKNSVIAEGGQTLVDLATGAPELDQYVDNKAERGDRGMWKAWGNAGGDLMHEAVTGQQTHGPQAYHTDFDSHKRKLDNARWYKPWTW